MRAIQFVFRKMDGPDKPGHDEFLLGQALWPDLMGLAAE
jgi:hypothetical protein